MNDFKTTESRGVPPGYFRSWLIIIIIFNPTKPLNHTEPNASTVFKMTHILLHGERA